MCLLREIDLYLRRTGISASRFGREAVHDPRFVHDLRNGREPRQAMVARVSAFLSARSAR